MPSSASRKQQAFAAYYSIAPGPTGPDSLNAHLSALPKRFSARPIQVSTHAQSSAQTLTRPGALPAALTGLPGMDDNPQLCNRLDMLWTPLLPPKGRLLLRHCFLGVGQPHTAARFAVQPMSMATPAGRSSCSHACPAVPRI